MSQLPMSVIGGYLGAGKTTLINQLLSQDHGLRILVLVNDFGSINIDASLLISADEDTIELANGCVCCTMGADLFLAVGDVLDRHPRPDHLIVEASGIANPARIANVAKAEPDLCYSGIVTVVDGKQGEALLADPLIAPQIEEQIACADVLAVSKCIASTSLSSKFKALNPKAHLTPSNNILVESILFAKRDMKDTELAHHPAYSMWSHISDAVFDQDVLAAIFQARPPALYRVKGTVRGAGGHGFLVQITGPDITLTRINQPNQTQLIGIGLASRLTQSSAAAWWKNHALNKTKDTSRA